MTAGPFIVGLPIDGLGVNETVACHVSTRSVYCGQKGHIVPVMATVTGTNASLITLFPQRSVVGEGRLSGRGKVGPV